MPISREPQVSDLGFCDRETANLGLAQHSPRRATLTKSSNSRTRRTARRSSTVEPSSGTAGEANGTVTFGYLRVPLTIRRSARSGRFFLQEWTDPRYPVARCPSHCPRYLYQVFTIPDIQNRIY